MNKSGVIKVDFLRGFKKSIPIVMGYIPVSFTFGLMAKGEGLDTFTTVLISIANFTSAGQFAGVGVIVNGGSFFEMATTTLVINIRYALMSLSLSQKITSIKAVKKMILSFGITDETFTVASFEEKPLNFPFLLGLNLFPYLSWITGTLLGAAISSVLSPRLSNSMGIALYGMFLALIVPHARDDKRVLSVVIFSIIVSTLLNYVDLFKSISSGWVIIISTVSGALFGATFFKEEN